MTARAATDRDRERWAAAQARRRQLAKRNAAIYRLPLNVETVAAALLVSGRDQGADLTDHATAERLLTAWVAETLEIVIDDCQTPGEFGIDRITDKDRTRVGKAKGSDE